MAKKVGHRAGEGGAYGNLGNAYWSLGDFSKAIEYLTKNLAIGKEVGDRAGEGGGAYGNDMVCWCTLARRSNTTRSTWRLPRRWATGRGRAGRTGPLSTTHSAWRLPRRWATGRGRSRVREPGECVLVAGELFQGNRVSRAVPGDCQGGGRPGGKGRAYGNLGNAHRSLGDYSKAIEYHKEHLAIAKEVGDRAKEGGAYGNLGNPYPSLQDFRIVALTDKRSERKRERE